MLDTEIPPPEVLVRSQEVNFFRDIVGEVIVRQEYIMESSDKQKMRSAIVKRVSVIKFDGKDSSAKRLVELVLDNGLLEWIPYDTAVQEIQDTIVEKRLERYVAKVCHDYRKWSGSDEFLCSYPLLGEIWINSNASDDLKTNAIKLHLESLLHTREGSKDALVGQIVVKSAQALDMFGRSPRMTLLIIRDVYKCPVSNQWLAELVFDDGTVDTSSLRSVRELHRLTMKDGRIKLYFDRLESDRIACQQQNVLINWDSHHRLNTFAFGKDADDLFTLLLNYLSKISQENPSQRNAENIDALNNRSIDATTSGNIDPVIGGNSDAATNSDSDTVTNSNSDVVTSYHGENPVPLNTYSSQRIKKPRTSYADYITDDSAYFPKRVTASVAEKPIKSEKVAIPKANSREIVPLSGAMNSSEDYNQINNSNIVYYQVSRGVLLLPDGSTYKCCADCHSHRVGVESCRLANFHTAPSWDNSALVPATMISQTSVYKRFEAASYEPLTQSGSSASNPMIPKQVSAIQAATSTDRNGRSTKSNDPRKQREVMSAGTWLSNRPSISLSSKFQHIATDFTEINAINIGDVSENDHQRLDKLEQLVLEMERNFVNIMKLQSLRTSSGGSQAHSAENVVIPTSEILPEKSAACLQIFSNLKSKINQARLENADFVSFFLPAELEVVRFWKLAESLKCESDILYSCVYEKNQDVPVQQLKSESGSIDVGNILKYVSQTMYLTTASLAQLLGFSSITLPQVSAYTNNHTAVVLSSMLRVADTRVQSFSQLGEVFEIIQTGMVKNVNREEVYEKKVVYLQDSLTLFESEANLAEKRRSDHAQRAVQEIAVIQEEEKILMEKLQKVRHNLYKTKRKHEYQRRRDVTRCNKSRDGRDKASNALTHCSSLLDKAKQSQIIFSGLRLYIQQLVAAFPLSSECFQDLQKIANIDSSSGMTSKTYNDENSSSSGTLLSTTTTTSKTRMINLDRLLLIRKVLEWVTNVQNISSSDTVPSREVAADIEDFANVNSSSLTPLQSRRVVYEGIRIARQLIIQCKSPFDIPEHVHFSLPQNDSAVANILHHSSAAEVSGVVTGAAEAADDFDNFLRICDPYDPNSPFIVAMTAPASLPELAINATEKPRRGYTLVLCDPRNLKHLSSKDMVERSLRIVRIMSRLAILQTAYKLEVNGTGTSTTHPLSCLSINDSHTDVPSCFLEALTLAHSEAYIDFLKKTCSAVDEKCKANQATNGTQPIITLNSAPESCEYAAVPSSMSTPGQSTELSPIGVENKRMETTIPLVFIKEAGAGFDVDDDDTVSFDEKEYVFSSLVPEEDDLLEDDESADAIAEVDIEEEDQQREGVNDHDGYSKNDTSVLQNGIPLSSVEVLKSFDPLKYDARFVSKNVEPDATSRVILWDLHRQKRLGGYAAPFFKNFKDSLIRSPHFVIYAFQDGKTDVIGMQLPVLQYLKSLLSNSNDENENIDKLATLHDHDGKGEVPGESMRAVDDTECVKLSASIDNADESINDESISIALGLPERVKVTLCGLTRDALLSVMEICSVQFSEEFAVTSGTKHSVTAPSCEYRPNAFDRVLLYDTVRRRRVGGNAAPYFKNLVDSLQRNTHFTIYAFQDNKCENLGNHVAMLVFLKRCLDPSFDAAAFHSRSVGDKSSRPIVDSTSVHSNKLAKTQDTDFKADESCDLPPCYEPRSNRIYSQALSRPGGTFIDELKKGVVTDGPGWWTEDHEADSCDTLVSPHSLEAALAAAIVVCVAVDAIHSGKFVGFSALADFPDEPKPTTTSSSSKVDDAVSTIENSATSEVKEADVQGSLSAAIEKFDGDHIVRSVYKEQAGYVTWTVYASLLLDYAIKHNTANIPFKEVQIYDGRSVSIGRWLCDQRCAKRQNFMPKERLIIFQKLVNRGKLWWDNPGVRKVPEIMKTSSEELAFYNSLKAEIFASETVLNALTAKRPYSPMSNESAASGVVYAVDNTSSLQLDFLDTVSVSSDDLAYYTTPFNAGLTDSVDDNNIKAESSDLQQCQLNKPGIQIDDVHNVFCCVRPPGHHAGRYGSTRGCTQNGFCLLNNVAIGAYYARIKYGYRRIAIIDFDAHFGNGTAEIFEKDPEAFYASVHLQSDNEHYPFFPSSNCCLLGGDTNETNRVFVNVFPGLKSSSSSNLINTKGAYNNFRLAFGMATSSKLRRGRDGFREGFVNIIIPRLKAFRPDIIFLSSGFDGMYSDPIGGGMELQPEDFHFVTKHVCQVSQELCGGRVVSVLEGGYDIKTKTDGLAIACEAHVKGLMNETWS